MNTGIDPRLKWIAKMLATLCTIELLLPGGMLIVLILLLTGGCHLGQPDEDERAAGIWHGVRGHIFGNSGDGDSCQADEPNRLPGSSQAG